MDVEMDGKNEHADDGEETVEMQADHEVTEDEEEVGEITDEQEVSGHVAPLPQTEIDVTQEIDENSLDLERGSREVLLNPGVLKRKSVWRKKRCWAGCCGFSVLFFIMSWFVIILPVTRSLITARSKTAAVDVSALLVHLDETHPIVKIESIEVSIAKSCWSMGIPIHFTAVVPPVNATVYVHLPNGSIVNSGVFESASSLHVNSWEDLKADISGVLRPDMSVIKELVLTTIRDPVILTHVETIIDVSATVFWIFPLSISQVPVETGIMRMDAMNNFRNTSVELVDYIHVDGQKDKLVLDVSVRMRNPTIFSSKMDGSIVMDVLNRKGRLGSVKMVNMTMLPKRAGATLINATFSLEIRDGNHDAFLAAVDDIMGDPTGFEPCGTRPLNTSAVSPMDGFPPTMNPLLREALSGNFMLNTSVTPLSFVPLTGVEVSIPTPLSGNDIVSRFNISNPLPAAIRIDRVEVDVFFPNVSGEHLYSMKKNLTGHVIQPRTVTSLDIAADWRGLDKTTVLRRLFELLFHLKNITVGVRGNFTVTILPDFTMVIPYHNRQLHSKIHWD